MHDRRRSKGFDTVLVLDFGAQYGQLIARRVRECRVYSRARSRTTRRSSASRSYDAQGHHPLRRPDERVRRGRAPGRPGDLRARHPGPRHLLRHPGIALELGGTVARTGLSEFGKTDAQRASSRGSLLDGLRGEEQCWMSHRDSVTERAARLRGAGGQPRRARGRHGGPRARLLRRAVPPRGRAHAQGHGHPAQLPLQGLRLRARRSRPTSIIEESIAQDPRAGGRRPRRSSASPAASTRRSPRCSCTGPSATSSPASSSTRA